MKILYANKYNFLKGGVETVLFSEMELMKSKGHEVAVFSAKDPRNRPSEYSDYFVDAMDFYEAGVFSKIKSALKIVYSLEAKKKFGEVIADFKPDIIHIHSIYAHLSSSILDAAKKIGVPVVMTVHDYKLVCPNYLMLNHGNICEKCIGHHYYQCFVTRCHKDSLIASAVNTAETYFNHWFGKYGYVSEFICPSEFMRTKLLDVVAPEKIKVVRNSVSVPHKVPSEAHQGYFLFTGRLSKEKGVGTLVRAFRELNLPLKIAGTGPQETEYKRLAENFPSIQFLGHKEGMVLEELYRGAYACVVPSEWYENAPMSVIEAFAYGKPVIGAKIGGITELIQEGINGMLFEAFNVDELKKKITELKGFSSDLYVQICGEARKSALEHFSPEKHYDQLMDLYRESCGKN